jgi:HPt (histidine-containing phosphotransfer) domain-containing protein
MTAHTTFEDRHDSRESVMSGRHKKPFDATESFPDQFGREQLPAAFDEAAAMLQVDGDIILLGELTEIFIDDSRNRMTDLRRAITQSDGPGVERIAHSIKGALSIFQARPSVEAAEQVEMLGRSRELDSAAVAFTVLEAEINRLIDALKLHLSQFPLDATEDRFS